jgi:hypothetical protein
MSRAKSVLLVRLALTGAMLVGLQGCSNQSNSEVRVEKPLPASTPQPSPAAATPVPKLPPPTEAEVQAAFHRVFGDSLIVSTSIRPFFIVGDFNGDESEDLALIARPAPGKLQDVNNELSNWTIQDADKALLPAAAKKVVMPRNEERPTVANGEEILAIIHGAGPMGWRSADARQAYIVKHAAAKLLGTAPSVSQKAIRAMHLPQETDIIKQVRNNKKGFLFWTGGVYAWHPSEG